ncbi:MAG TPA: response regulator [Bryobacteraceae bacterium]|nr:response regulator [Bryobacteraceae bacterium]
MRRILFVDDEPKVLEALRRSLRALRGEWTMEFAPGGAEALQALSSESYDVIVADMRMPGMTGAQLLAQVTKLYPRMIRIILSGTWDQDLRLQAVMTAHQYLSKPCDAETLRSTVSRAFALRDVLRKPGLEELITRVGSLPSVPAIYQQLVETLRSPETSAKDVGAIISGDIAMTAKVLQLVNSAFFGIRKHISSPAEAVSYLGVDAIKALTLSLSVFSAFSNSHSARFSIDALQWHCNSVGKIAIGIATETHSSQQMRGDIMVAGLLHDLGKLVLASLFPDEYDRVLEIAPDCGPAQLSAEREAFGAAHAEIGAHLLWLWGLPDAVVEAVAFHHDPASAPTPGFSPAGVIHVADVLEGWREPLETGVWLDREYLSRVGVAVQLPVWAAHLEDQPGESPESA